ncbi:MAG: chorismate synthase [Clostridia bacterium]|nr:chorismate synthase [Clostridia bacterium]
MNSFGDRIRFTVFGTSHGVAVGCTLDGLPAGFKPDLDAVRFELSRRSPRASSESTSRQEDDEFEILSGLFNGCTDGAPVCAVFKNKNADPADYKTRAVRPSHADYAAYVKYSGCNDPRGGGMFSGRMTAPIVFAGALIKQLLACEGISIRSHIANIGGIIDDPFVPTCCSVPELDPFFPLVNSGKKPLFEALFDEVRSCGDSIGGTVECLISGVPAGVGEPFFDSIESVLSHILFSIPGVHGVEFGAGFSLASMRGSEANDAILAGGKTSTNNSGGINGGISNGMPIIFRCVFRPVPSIAAEQDSIDIETGKAVKVRLSGRHDACILPRGCAVIEAAAAIAVYDLFTRGGNAHE